MARMIRSLRRVLISLISILTLCSLILPSCYWWRNDCPEEQNRKPDPIKSLVSDSEVYLKGCPGNDNWWKSVNPDLQKFLDKLDKYAHFHRQQLKLIQDGHVSPSEVRTLTWSCPDGTYCFGLGDQINRIVTAFLLALISDRVFYIYWNPVTLKTMKYLEPHAIRWDQYSNDVNGVPSLLVDRMAPTRAEDIIKESIFSKNFTDVTISIQTHPNVFAALKEIAAEDRKTIELFHKIGIPIDSMKYSVSVDSIMFVTLHYLFTFSHQLTDQVDQIQKDIGLTKPYIGIHIRTGFVGSKYEEKTLNHKKLISERRLWYNSLACSIQKANRLLSKTALIYLATDSYRVKKMAKSINPIRIVTLNMTLQHVGFANMKDFSQKDLDKMNLIDNGDLEDSKPLQESSKKDIYINGEISTWIDFMLLARSYAIFRTDSCFSMLASRICYIPRTHWFSFPECDVFV